MVSVCFRFGLLWIENDLLMARWGYMTRYDGRSDMEMRPVKITRQFIKHAEGSVLIEVGDTKVMHSFS